jgi:hypothetical protein
MNKQMHTLLIVLSLSVLIIPIVGAYEENNISPVKSGGEVTAGFSEDYGIQWVKSYGSDPSYGARYEGPQPIGDCDNDGDNELLISGRDAMIRVMEWNDQQQNYLQTHVLHCPFYYLLRFLGRFDQEIEPMLLRSHFSHLR